VVVVDIRGKIPREMWNFEYYAPLIPIARRNGFISGASWVTIKDGPHIEHPSYRSYSPEA
jgi:hypothetical protein